jgi:hypothetical protein
LKAAVDWYERNYGVNIFNHSLEGGGAIYTQFLDWMAVQRDVLNVIAAGNMNPAPIDNPAAAYNGLVVGATERSFQKRASYSDHVHPTLMRPHLVAPGGDPKGIPNYDGIDNAPNGNASHLEDNGTSFAAPHVTGVVAMLAEKGLTMGTGNPRNRLAQRSIIMNSARKRHINAPKSDHAVIMNSAGAANPADGDYLMGKTIRMGGSATAPATVHWTPEAWSSPDGLTLTVTKPLDDELGTGALDAERALIQFEGGEHKEKQFNLAGVPKIGWNRTFLNADFGLDIYEFNFAIPKGGFITTTLNWDRPIKTPDGDDDVESSDTYGYGGLPDFDLFIYKGDNILARSISTGDTNEHLHFPIPETCGPLECSIRVDLLGTGTTNFDYGLAWWTVPEPTSAVLAVIAMLLYVAAGRRK